MYQVFNANNSKLAQSSFDYIIACNWSAFAIDLNESTLVNQVSNRFQVDRPPCNVRFTNTEHVDSSLIQFDEYAIVDLTKSEELKNLLDFRGNLIDTSNSDDKGKFGLRWDIVITFLLGLTG